MTGSILDDRPRPVPLARAVCCRTWPVLAVAGMGRCGYCGVRPVVVGPWDEPAP